MKASSLNTNDCFVLIHPEENYVWLGKGSTGDEREMAKNMATLSGAQMQMREKNIYGVLIVPNGNSTFSEVEKNRNVLMTAFEDAKAEGGLNNWS